MDADFEVALLEPCAGRDAALADELAALINDVYAVAERGLWRDGAARTTADEVSGLIRAGEIAVATRGDRIVGSVRVREVRAGVGEFGLLVAAPGERGTGVGRALVDFAEAHSRARGSEAMQLELLVPRGWSHPGKELLKAWYGRRGYTLGGVERFDTAYPAVALLLATPCDLEVRSRSLAG